MPEIPRYNRKFYSGPVEQSMIPPSFGQDESLAMGKVGGAITDLTQGFRASLKHSENLNYVIDTMTKTSQSWDEYEARAQAQAAEGALGHFDQAKAWWDQNLSDAEVSAPSEEAKLAVKQHLSTMRQRAIGAAAKFEAAKRLEYFGNNLNNSLEQSYTEAFRNPDMAEELDLRGKGFLFAAAHPQSGWLDRNSADIAYKAHREKVYTSAFQGLTELDPARAVEEIKSGQWDSRLSKDSIIKLQSHAESVLEHRGRLNLSMLNQSMKDNLVSIQNTGQAIPGLMQRVYGGQKPEIVAQYVKDVERAQAYYDTVQDISFKPYPEARAKVEERLPMPGTEGYEDNLRLYNDLHLFLEKREKALRDDPANYALRAPGVKDYGAIVAQQAALGIPEEERRLLPNNAAAKLVGKFNTAPADQRVQMIHNWKKDAGQHWPVLLRDLVRQKMDPENEILVAVHDLPWAPTVLPVISEAIKQGEQELKKSLTSDAVKKVDEAVRDEMADWRGSIMKGDYTGARVSWANGIQKAVSLTALVYAQRGIDPKEAGRRAVDEIVTRQYHEVNSNYRVPMGFDAGKVKDFALMRLRDLKSADFIPHGTLKEGITPEQAKDDFLKAVQKSGYFATNEDESGLVLMDPLGLPVMVRDSGKPLPSRSGKLEDLLEKPSTGRSRRYEFTFEEAEKYKDPAGIGPLRHMNFEDLDGLTKQMYKDIDSPHIANVLAAAKKYGVDPSLAAFVHFSEWDPRRNVSSKGAIGPMQLMPGTAKDLGVDPNDPVQNVYGGVKYLSMLLQRYNGDEAKALVGYNWGHVNADKWDGRMESLPDETQKYLKTILG
ncbi:MAG: lytic transglycosylase domain-containing protein [Syntrophaceae bacterium]